MFKTFLLLDKLTTSHIYQQKIKKKSIWKFAVARFLCQTAKNSRPGDIVIHRAGAYRYRTRLAQETPVPFRRLPDTSTLASKFFNRSFNRSTSVSALNTMLCNRRSHKNNGRHSEVINKHKLDPGRSNLCNRNRGDPGASECLITHDDNLLGKWTHKQQ